jgi:hypothetical protein
MITFEAQSGTVSLHIAGRDPVTLSRSSANVETARWIDEESEELVMIGTSDP